MAKRKTAGNDSKQTDGAKAPKKPRAKKEAAIIGSQRGPASVARVEASSKAIKRELEEAKLGIDGDAIDLPMVTHNQEYAPATDANSTQGAKTLGEVFLEIPIGPPHQAFPTSLLPEGASFEALGVPAASNNQTPGKTEPSEPTQFPSSALRILEGTEETHNGDINTTGRLRQPSQTIVQDGSNDTADSSQTPQSEPDASKGITGDDSLSVAETAALYVESAAEKGPIAHAKAGETQGMCWERLRREARAAGMPRGQGPGTAYEWATRETDRLFPPKLPEPIESEPEPIVEPAIEPIATKEPEPEFSPIGEIPTQPPKPEPADTLAFVIPATWPELPDNATLQAEISWVSANRLRVRDGNGVDLSKAKTPAPSYSALSWLETSILFPSKFADISVKATANQDDEREAVRREKLSIEEIRGLLAEMLDG